MTLVTADFQPAAPVGAQPGTSLNLASWTISGLPTDTPMYLEFFASRTGGFSLARLGGTMTPSATALVARRRHEDLHADADAQLAARRHLHRGSIREPTRDFRRPQESDYSDNWAPIAGKRLRVRNTQSPNCNIVLENAQFTRNGTAVTVTAKVRNAGPGTSPAYGFWVETAHGVLSPEGLFTPTGYISGGQHVGPLAPNATFNYSQTGSAPTDAALAVMADSTDLIPETNEQDNWSWNGSLSGRVRSDGRPRYRKRLHRP